jgi:hypothetical protein
MNTEPTGFLALCGRLFSNIGGLISIIQDGVKGKTPKYTETGEAKKEERNIPPLVRARVEITESVEVHKSKADATAAEKYEFRTLLFSGLSLGVAVLTLISLIIYACITHRQLHAMLASNEINRAALVATQRAYVGVTGLNIERSRYNPKLVTYFVSPVIVNTGNTPTKNLWFTAVWGAVPTEVDHEPTIQDISSATQNYGTLAAHQEIRDLIKQPIPTEYATILRSSNSQKHIPIFGAIVYEDGMSEPPVTHIRRYCYSLYVNPFFTPPDSFSYVMCGGRSNCEDEECGEETQRQLKKMAKRPN